MGRKKQSNLSPRELGRIRQQRRRMKKEFVALSVEVSPNLLEQLKCAHQQGTWREFLNGVIKKGLKALHGT